MTQNYIVRKLKKSPRDRIIQYSDAPDGLLVVVDDGDIYCYPCELSWVKTGGAK